MAFFGQHRKAAEIIIPGGLSKEVLCLLPPGSDYGGGI